MQDLEIIIVLMAVLVWLNSLASKSNLPYPILLVVAGLVISIIPGLPLMRLNPQIVFLVFLPPLLFEAASNTSWHDFRKYRRPILLLAIGLVVFTTLGVATAAHYMIPGFTWPLSFLLGAIVSPPDAVAATSVTKNLRLPRHVLTILEGESLINDASALMIYRYAMFAIVGSQTSAFALGDASLQFMEIFGSSVVIGVVVGYIFGRIYRGIENPTAETTISLIAPFVAYLIAESLEASGVLAVVTTGMYITWQSSEILSFETRIKIKGFWDIVVFLLNGFVFIIIGLQLPAILADQSDDSILHLIAYGLLISAVALIVRIGWIFPIPFIRYTLSKLWKKQTKSHSKKWRELFIISWAGMRGVVSLASAMAIPLTLDNGTPFPERNVILFITFVVILVTLVFQGLTLPYFVKKLNVQESDHSSKISENQLRLEILNDSIQFIEQQLSCKFPSRVIELLRLSVSSKIEHIKNDLANMPSEKDIHRGQFYEAEMEMCKHQHQLLIKLHKNNVYSNEVIRKVEQDLDVYSMGTHTHLKSIKRRSTLNEIKTKH